MKQQNIATLRCAEFTVIAALTIAIAAIPALAQNAVLPTAREAASSPVFASRLHPTATPEAANKSLALVHSRTRTASLQGNLLYANGPVNGICDIQGCMVDAWTINFGFNVTNSFTGSGTVGGFNLAFWMFPGDTLGSVDWSVGATPFGSDLGKGTASVGAGNLTQQSLFTNDFGFNIVAVGITGLNVSVGGTSWVTLANAVVSSGDPVYWDENNGPSLAQENSVGTIPSESFNVTSGGPCLSDDPNRMQATQGAQAQSFKVIYNFTGGQEGVGPQGLTIDQAGNFYGTTVEGGNIGGSCNTFGFVGCGTVFKLSHEGAGWLFNPLYKFRGADSGNG